MYKKQLQPRLPFDAERMQVLKAKHSTRERFVCPTSGLARALIISQLSCKLLALYKSNKNFLGVRMWLPPSHRNPLLHSTPNLFHFCAKREKKKKARFTKQNLNQLINPSELNLSGNSMVQSKTNGGINNHDIANVELQTSAALAASSQAISHLMSPRLVWSVTAYKTPHVCIQQCLGSSSK